MGVITETTKTKKFIPPDTTAQIFWLKNRNPEQWRDKPTVSAGETDMIKGIKDLADILKNSRPNRKLEDYE